MVNGAPGVFGAIAVHLVEMGTKLRAELALTRHLNMAGKIVLGIRTTPLIAKSKTAQLVSRKVYRKQ